MPAPASPPRFPRKTALVLATLLVTLTLWHIRVGSPTGISWASIAENFKVPPSPAHHSAVRTAVPGVAGSGQPEAIRQADQPPTALLVDNAGSLDHFYAALHRLDAHSAMPSAPPAPDLTATVLHFGDSPTTADLITGDVRQQLQQRFGDAGQGFNLIAKPWAWYGHRDIDESDRNWKWTTAVGFMKEGNYGIGGAAFDGNTGATSAFILKGAPPAAVDLAYATQPDGGAFTLSADGVQIAEIHTSEPEPTRVTPPPATQPPPVFGSTFRTVALPANTRRLDLAVTSGTVRFYGIRFLRQQPGIFYDSLGLNGASTTVLSRAMPEAMMKQAFAHLHPDLIVINYGTNEAGFSSFVQKQYEGELRTAIARVKAAAPEASILIMSPMDRGERGAGNSISTMATIPQLVAIQQRVAAATGCAFFNTFAAMGGDGTMQRWYAAKPRLVGGDLIHPSPAGAKIVADIFVAQLNQGYARYVARKQPQSQANEPTAQPAERSAASKP